MNGEFKRYIYVIGTICVIFLVGSVVLKILPWLLLVGVIAYVVTKIVGLLKRKIKKKNSNTFYKNYNDNEYVYKDSVDDYTNGEIIDVEYEDVDNKER